MKILIQSAFAAELESFILANPIFTPKNIAKRQCWFACMGEHEVFVTYCGIGTTSAANTTTALCEALSLDCILICGSAGGLLAGQRIGDLVLGSAVVDMDLYELPAALKGTPYEACLIDPHLQKPILREFFPDDTLLKISAKSHLPRVRQGIIATTNTFPAPKETFALIKSLGCAAIEMESSGVLNAARYYEVPVIAVRAISNALDDAGNDLGTSPDAIQICSHRLSAFITEWLVHMQRFQTVLTS